MNTSVPPAKYELDDIQRIKITNHIYIQSPHLTNALRSIERCRGSFQVKPEPNCILVYGDRGTGKTSLINRYIAKNTRKHLEDGSSIIPVFSSEVQAASTVSQFYTSLLKGLGDPFPEKGQTVPKGERLHRLLRELKTELIIIDEFHELLDGQNQKVMTNVASAIKTLINQTKIPVILAGTAIAKIVLDNNHELRRRFRTSEYLPRFSIHTEQEQFTFRKFLAEYDKALPFMKLSNLPAMETYERMFAASLGLPSGIGSLLSEAAELAIYDGSESIGTEHLIEGYNLSLLDQTEIPGNPFEVNISELRTWDVLHPVKSQEVFRLSNLRQNEFRKIR